MLENLLKQCKCFKLVCGAGNEELIEVERLVYVYSKAGCRFFDVSANVDVIKAAKRGLKNSKIKENCYICVSVGIAGDPHINKAEIDNEICSKCAACINICPQYAIKEDVKSYQIKKESCIGCANCVKICPNNAISLHPCRLDTDKYILAIIKEGIDCIELHATVENDEEVMHKWNSITSLYGGLVSICLDRSNLSNKKYISRIKKVISERPPYSTIIQADGVPMSGANDDYKSTLQAVAAAEIVQNENLPVYLLVSGGTNAKTKYLANLCGVFPNGIAIGSYARKIVKKYIKREDFYTNTKVQEDAVKIAKDLVASCIE